MEITVIEAEDDPCSISGFVYVDMNSDGVKDNDDVGLGGSARAYRRPGRSVPTDRGGRLLWVLQSSGRYIRYLGNADLTLSRMASRLAAHRFWDRSNKTAFRR